MNPRHLIVLLLLALTACTALSPEEVAAATLYFPPRIKRLDEPVYAFSPAERARALQEFRQQGADTLFEFVIDAEGKVKRVRLLRTHVSSFYEQDMLDHALWFGFTADRKGTGYRAFFLPMNYRVNATFDWVDSG